MVQPRPEGSSKLVMKLMLVNPASKLLSPGCKSLMHHIDEEWSVILSFKLMFKFTVPEELVKLKTRFMCFSL